MTNFTILKPSISFIINDSIPPQFSKIFSLIDEIMNYLPSSFSELSSHLGSNFTSLSISLDNLDNSLNHIITPEKLSSLLQSDVVDIISPLINNIPLDLNISLNKILSLLSEESPLFNNFLNKDAFSSFYVSLSDFLNSNFKVIREAQISSEELSEIVTKILLDPLANSIKSISSNYASLSSSILKSFNIVTTPIGQSVNF
jgi:hypothetical protein